MAYDYSRDQMAEIIKSGGSVLIDGKLIRNVDELPGPVSFISTPEEKAKVEEELKAKVDTLNSQLDAVSKKDVTAKDVIKK